MSFTDEDLNTNEAVAVKLGWKEDKPHGWIKPKPHLDGFLIGQPELPKYCTDISAAWEIVEAMSAKLPMVYCDLDLPWGCRIGDVQAWADTAPMAICLAFLKLEEK